MALGKGVWVSSHPPTSLVYICCLRQVPDLTRRQLNHASVTLFPRYLRFHDADFLLSCYGLRFDLLDELVRCQLVFCEGLKWEGLLSEGPHWGLTS